MVKISTAMKSAIKSHLATQPNGPLQPTLFRWAGKTYILTACNGEAHDPSVGGMIDNCYQCAPLWGIRCEALDVHTGSYLEWLASTLIPDLRESGRDGTADDLAHCVTLLRAYGALPGGK